VSTVPLIKSILLYFRPRSSLLSSQALWCNRVNLPLLSATPKSIADQMTTSVVQPSGFITSTAIKHTAERYRSQPALHIEVVNPYGLTSTSNTCCEHTHPRQDVKDSAHIKPAILSSCRCAGKQWFNHQGLLHCNKHIAESGEGHRPFVQLCTSKWFNHVG
jgi:hypothetical protein